jgi:hypothetical protein
VKRPCASCRQQQQDDRYGSLPAHAQLNPNIQLNTNSGRSQAVMRSILI